MLLIIASEKTPRVSKAHATTVTEKRGVKKLQYFHDCIALLPVVFLDFV
jgi:hypothetical protein